MRKLRNARYDATRGVRTEVEESGKNGGKASERICGESGYERQEARRTTIKPWGVICHGVRVERGEKLWMYILFSVQLCPLLLTLSGHAAAKAVAARAVSTHAVAIFLSSRENEKGRESCA